MSGRTTWWPCDAAEHDRELNVELGEEFGPGGPYLMRVLKDLAQQQRDEGRVRAGFRVLRAKAFIGDTATTRAIVERAAEIGALDDLEVDPDGRRFTCRVSGWEADQVRGRAAITKAAQRANAEGQGPPEPEGVHPDPDTPPALSPENRTTDASVRSHEDVSGSVPLAEQSRTEQNKAAAAAARPRDSERVEHDLRSIAERHGVAVPTASELDEVLAEHPTKDVAAALNDVKRWARRDCPHNLVGAFRRALASARDLPEPERPVEADPATPEDEAAWAAARKQLRERNADLFDMWIEPVRLAGRGGDELVLEAPTSTAAWVRERWICSIIDALGNRAVRIVGSDSITPQQRDRIRALGQQAREINTRAEEAGA